MFPPNRRTRIKHVVTYRMKTVGIINELLNRLPKSSNTEIYVVQLKDQYHSLRSAEKTNYFQSTTISSNRIAKHKQKIPTKHYFPVMTLDGLAGSLALEMLTCLSVNV